MEEKAVCLRKGAWSKEEDHLLTKCIHKHGEGRWHLVPLRAGVNRCRKSCRLRWLNYLSPNIKRGSFAKDEIDLIFRLHKLLGNRWSLIAGRIPGRTSNDVKNFWNTYIVDKKPSPPQVESIVTKSNNTIIKPRPRIFSRKPQVESITPDTITNQLQTPDEKNYKSKNNMLSLDDIDDDQLVVAQEEGENECMSWWSSLLIINENENMSGAPFLFPEDEPILPNHVISNHAKNIDHELSDIDLYADLWDFFSMDRITTID